PKISSCCATAWSGCWRPMASRSRRPSSPAPNSTVPSPSDPGRGGGRRTAAAHAHGRGLQCALRARRERPGLPVLVLSQHVEQLYARELLADGSGAVGYLLKDRVFDAAQFVDAVRRVAAGGTAMDPQVIQQLLARRSDRDRPLSRLTPRELEVLELMAQGRSNTAIAAQLVVTERAIAKHTSNIFAKLGLEVSDDDNRRVLAVLAHLDRDR
ncbi:LOW QUALITY PROTEIN: two-component system response regulator, partial [Streptomyces sp. e14]